MRQVRAIFGILLFASVLRAQQPEARPLIPTWEQEIAKGYLPYRQVTVKDFPIDDKAHPKSAYWVQPFTHYYFHYISRVSPGGMVYLNVTDWTVHSGFDKNLSSRNRHFAVAEMKEQLPYIQTLLDISELHARYLAALKAGELPSAEGRTFEEARAQIESRVEAMVKSRISNGDDEIKAFMKASNNGQDGKIVRAMAADTKKRLAGAPTPIATETPLTSPSVPNAPSATPGTK